MEINKSKAFFPGSCKSPFFFAIHPPPNTKALILRGFGGGGKGVEIWEPAARLKWFFSELYHLEDADFASPTIGPPRFYRLFCRGEKRSLLLRVWLQQYSPEKQIECPAENQWLVQTCFFHWKWRFLGDEFVPRFRGWFLQAKFLGLHPSVVTLRAENPYDLDRWGSIHASSTLVMIASWLKPKKLVTKNRGLGSWGTFFLTMQLLRSIQHVFSRPKTLVSEPVVGMTNLAKIPILNREY